MHPVLSASQLYGHRSEDASSDGQSDVTLTEMQSRRGGRLTGR